MLPSSIAVSTQRRQTIEGGKEDRREREKERERERERERL
jgi:hypothetical protein